MIARAWSRSALALAAAGVLSCGSVDAAPEPDDAGADVAVPPDASVADGEVEGDGGKGPTIEAVVRKNPDNAVGALVDVKTTAADHVQIEWGDTTAYGSSSPSLALSSDGKATVPIFGMPVAGTAHVRAIATGPSGTARTGDLTVTMDPFPIDWGSPFKVLTDDGTARGYVAIAMINAPSDMAGGAIIDRKGRLQWYRKAKQSSFGLAFDRRKNGNFVIFQLPLRGFEELDPSTTLVRTWKDPASIPLPRGADGHDFQENGGDAVLIGWDSRKLDTRPYFPGGVLGANVLYNTIDRVDPSGKVVFHWSAYPEIGLDEFIEDPAVPTDPSLFEAVHTNSVEVTPAGDYIVSHRMTSSVTKVDHTTGKIAWRLGGKKSDFTFVSDPDGGFSMQHDARLLPSGELMLMDNGVLKDPPRTRVAVYALDEKARTATLTWSYHHVPELYSQHAGSSRRLPDGHTLIAFSRPGIVTEIDAAGKVVWELQLVYFAAYRALPIASLYP